jgi:hypothetical protein
MTSLIIAFEGIQYIQARVIGTNRCKVLEDFAALSVDKVGNNSIQNSARLQYDSLDHRL